MSSLTSGGVRENINRADAATQSAKQLVAEKPPQLNLKHYARAYAATVNR